MDDRKNGRSADGRFGTGNPGRPPGVRNRATLAVEALLADEAQGLARKAVELALGGDTTALRLCLERIAPAYRPSSSPVQFDLDDSRPLAEQGLAVLRAVADGHVAPDTGRSLIDALAALARVNELDAFDRRLTELESR